MYAGLMGKGVLTGYGLVCGNMDAAHRAYKVRNAVYGGNAYAVIKAVVILPCYKVHYHLFKGGVSGALAYAVYGALHLTGACFKGRQGCWPPRCPDRYGSEPTG